MPPKRQKMPEIPTIYMVLRCGVGGAGASRIIGNSLNPKDSHGLGGGAKEREFAYTCRVAPAKICVDCQTCV